MIVSDSVAVLEHVDGVQILWRASGGRRISRELRTLEDFAELARAAETYQLWILPSWSTAHPDVDLVVDSHHWVPLELSDKQRAILEVVDGDEALPRVLREAPSGPALLEALLTVEGLIGTHWRGTGGATGMWLLRRYLRQHDIPLGVIPPVPFPTEPDFGWRRPLTAEEKTRRWLYVFDRHNQYLTAAQTVELGIGEPEFRAHPTFHARTPGLWHVQTSTWSTESLLPDPTTEGAPARRPRGLRWLTTPSVEAALAAGILESVEAAWYWPTHGRLLRPLASILRSAIAEKRAPIVRETLKSIYAETFGGYLASGEAEKRRDLLYRPDWRDAVKAEARTRLWYLLRPLAAAGIPPVAIAIDAVYIPSNESTPEGALRGLLTLGALPLQWAYVRRVALADVLDVLPDAFGPTQPLRRRIRAIAEASAA